jgi:hypothetical protein
MGFAVELGSVVVVVESNGDGEGGASVVEDHVDEKQHQSEFEFRISGPISKARSERISGQIRIMVNEVHYSYFRHLLLSFLSSLSNKW